MRFRRRREKTRHLIVTVEFLGNAIVVLNGRTPEALAEQLRVNPDGWIVVEHFGLELTVRISKVIGYWIEER